MEIETQTDMGKDKWIEFCRQKLAKGKNDFTKRTFVRHTSCSCYRCKLLSNGKRNQIEYKTSNRDCARICTEEEFVRYVYKNPGNNETHGDLAINLLEMETEEKLKERVKSKKTRCSPGDIHIKDHICEPLLDHSADISAVALKIVETLSGSQLVRWNRKSHSSNLMVDRVGGRRLTTTGKATLRLSLGEQDFEWEFLVVDFLVQDCILGRDFIVEKVTVFDWLTCPNLFNSSQGIKYFCRNSTLRIRAEISKYKSCIGYEEHWLIHVMILHIGLDMCSHTISVDYTQLEETMLELADMMHEGIGIELTIGVQETYCNTRRRNWENDSRKHTHIEEDKEDVITWEEEVTQRLGHKMGIKVNTESGQTRIYTIPSLENIAANVIITNEAHRKCLQTQQMNGSKEIRTCYRNLFRRYIRHSMRLTCARWKTIGMGKYCRTFAFPMRGHSEENPRIREECEVSGNMNL